MDDLPSYLQELDQLLLDQSDDCMLLTQLDGFLAGVLVSPDLIPPGAWLKSIWAGEDGEGTPDFEDMPSFERFIDLIMQHYNQILASLNVAGGYEPVLETDLRNGHVLWEMWIDGFDQAMHLSPNGWDRLSSSDSADCKSAIRGIETLHAFANGTKKLSRKQQDRWDAEAPELIPQWVEVLHTWRLKNQPDRQPSAQHRKVGRNEPCSCGSGKKYKKCCGLN